MPGLGTSFGRGGATTFQQDLINSDCILIMGSNMAEAHPIAFSWALRAKERGAVLIHVDPRFSRTSALCSLYVPIRPGSDIVFLGGLINYVLTSEQYFREYVVAYTNAATIISERFRDTEDLGGVFSGYDPDARAYDPSSWAYEMETVDGVARPKTDPTLQHPRCVFQILRRHFARYTPEMVEAVCGTPQELFLRVASALVANSGRERTSAICYALGWTQHSKGAQTIRAAAILQLLLGNIGRPGGGILALRGHASIQGSTDVPTLYDLLSGYMPQPTADPRQQTLAGYIETVGSRSGVWGNLPRFIVSFLKAWYGDAARPENDFCYAHVPKTVGDHSHLATTFEMIDGKIKGFLVLGQNPAAGSSHARLQRRALANLDWLVVRDLYETETAAFWKAPVDGVDPSTIRTEVFFLPAAGPGEKAGCFTNTQRLIQWKEKAVDPPGDARSDAWFIHQLARRLKALYASSTDPRDRPIQDLFWDFDRVAPEPGSRIPDEPDIEKVLKEINGFTWPDRRQLTDASELRDDGTTACGSWIYCGVYPAEGVNRAASRIPDDGVSPNWGFAWPSNRRILYNRASADPHGRPWSERKRYVWWDEAQQVWTGRDVPDFPLTKPPTDPGRPSAVGIDALGGADPFIMRPDGKGWLFAPSGLKDGPLPTHYEPAESPGQNLLYREQRSSPVARSYRHRADNPLAPAGDPRFPIVLTTYRLTEHHVSGQMTRWLPWLTELQPELFVEMSPELAAERRVRHGDWVTIVSARGAIEARAMVTRRLRPLRIGGQVVHQVGLPFHWGYQGLATGAIANDLTHLVLEPNVSIYEVKALMVDLRPGRLADQPPEVQPPLQAGRIIGTGPDAPDVPPASLREEG